MMLLDHSENLINLNKIKMGELTIEQKAKAYDEAVENMRKFRNALNNHEETDLWVSKKRHSD